MVGRLFMVIRRGHSPVNSPLSLSLSRPSSHPLIWQRDTRGALSRGSALDERGELKTSNLRDTKAPCARVCENDRAAVTFTYKFTSSADASCKCNNRSKMRYTKTGASPPNVGR